MIRPGIHERIRALPGIDAAELAVQGPGCVACDGLGIIGRTVCAEILLPDDGILEMLRAGRYKDAKDHWRSRKAKRAAGPLFSMAGVSALEHAIQKMRAGEVSCEDVESCLGQLTGEPSSAMQVLDAFADFEDS
jgi:type II secretory ATPase GspE/PulE/Tfp pilus assembly ATPase PilB-like protein